MHEGMKQVLMIVRIKMESWVDRWVGRSTDYG